MNLKDLLHSIKPDDVEAAERISSAMMAVARVMYADELIAATALLGVALAHLTRVFDEEKIHTLIHDWFALHPHVNAHLRRAQMKLVPKQTTSERGPKACVWVDGPEECQHCGNCNEDNEGKTWP